MTVEADLLARFRDGPTIIERWDAARELMAARNLIRVLETEDFRSGFVEIAKEAELGDGISRLIAVELIVRLSNFAKKLAPLAQTSLHAALASELPPASLLSASKKLPTAAKPAEFRENLAIALKYASGKWVIPYALKTLIEEDRSQRSRLELVRQLVSREPSVDRLLEGLVAPIRQMLGSHTNLEIAAARLRDLTAALADVINKNRVDLIASEKAARSCAALCDFLVPISKNTKLPKNLPKAASQVARLLDEIFAVRLTLIVEPEAYAVLEVFDRWWRPLPYPKPVKTALRPIVDKLVTGITLRARWGQRSETLATRLKQGLGDRSIGDKRLQQIADEEKGITPEIDDWLRGRQRRDSGTATSLTQALRSVENEDLTEAIALLLLDCEDLLKTEIGDLFGPGRRLATAVRSLASQRGLEVEGQSGEVVEYLPMAHETVSGEPPKDLMVTVVRPMVVRRRRDGTQDIIIRAIVSEANRATEKD